MIFAATGLTVVVVDVAGLSDTLASSPATSQPTAPIVSVNAAEKSPTANPAPSLRQLLDPSQIIIWTQPATRQEVLRRLVETIASDQQLSVEEILARLEAREKQGSTFLNDGLALPHARIPGLTTPRVALGLTHAGISDVGGKLPVKWVFLLLSPIGQSQSHLHLLASAVRIFQDRDLRRRLDECVDPTSAQQEIFRRETEVK